jgi:hypothetical protein
VTGTCLGLQSACRRAADPCAGSASNGTAGRAYADAHYAGRFSRLDIRFRGALCYIDAHIEPQPTVPVHLCRLRYFGDEEAWSVAFFTYSHERYEPSVFPNGTFHGTPEEAFELAAVYL